MKIGLIDYQHRGGSRDRCGKFRNAGSKQGDLFGFTKAIGRQIRVSMDFGDWYVEA